MSSLGDATKAIPVCIAPSFRTSLTAVSLLASLVFPLATFAQRAQTPTLMEILQRLAANQNHYDAGLPSLFCDEHVISKVEPGQRKQNITTDSVFRLKRTLNPDHTTALVESREVKSVDGKPASSQDLKGPTVLSGAFEGGLAVVSLSQTACMSYTLQRVNRKRPAEPYVIRFATALTSQNSADCLLQEKSQGRAFIDPASMQITHLEMTAPRHAIIPGDAYTSPVVGKRVLSVDYGPVLFDDETFWMPSAITSRATSDPGTFHTTVWSFSAAYSDYHKMKVTTRILPGSGAPIP